MTNEEIWRYEQVIRTAAILMQPAYETCMKNFEKLISQRGYDDDLQALVDTMTNSAIESAVRTADELVSYVITHTGNPKE